MTVAGIKWNLPKLSQCTGATNRGAISLIQAAKEELSENFARPLDKPAALLTTLPLDNASRTTLGWEGALMSDQYMLALIS